MNGSEASSDVPVRLARACCTPGHNHLTQPGVSFSGFGNTPRRTNSSTVLSQTSSAAASVALLTASRCMSAGVRLISRIVSVRRTGLAGHKRGYVVHISAKPVPPNGRRNWFRAFPPPGGAESIYAQKKRCGQSCTTIPETHRGLWITGAS